MRPNIGRLIGKIDFTHDQTKPLKALDTFGLSKTSNSDSVMIIEVAKNASNKMLQA